MSPITTHVLDLASGKPASGLSVTLSVQKAEDSWEQLALGVTDSNGRIVNLGIDDWTLAEGIYRLRFDTSEYFDNIGVKAFYPSVVVAFLVDNPSAHYHVPLLLSPFGYSTYRGS